MGHLLTLTLIGLLIFLSAFDYGIVIFFGLPVLVLNLSWSFPFFHTCKITVGPDGITIQKLFSKSKRQVAYSEIKAVHSKKVIRENRRGNITDGYFEMEFILSDDKVLIVSAECYENADEIKSGIIEQTNALNPEKQIKPRVNPEHKSIFYS